MASAGTISLLRALAHSLVSFTKRHQLSLFVASIAAAAICFAALPATTLEESLVQSTALAVVSLLVVGLGCPQALSLHGKPKKQAVVSLCRWAGYMLVVGLAGGIAAAALATFDAGVASGAFATEADSVSSAPGAAIPAASSVAQAIEAFATAAGAQSIIPAFPLVAPVQIIALCLLTGVFEEGVFRVLAIGALAPALGKKCEWRPQALVGQTDAPRCLLGRSDDDSGLLQAAVVSAMLFGALHAPVGDVLALGDATAWMQGALKPVQSGLFGFFMAALWVRTGNLWILAATHGAFNLLYTGPLLLLVGMPTTYVTGSPIDLALLAVFTALLLPPAAAAFRYLRTR